MSSRTAPAWIVAVVVGLLGPSPGPAAGQAPIAPGPIVPFATLKGRVTSKDGAALPGARVLIAIPAVDMRFADADAGGIRLETRTGADGGYRFEIHGIAGRAKVSIDAMVPGYRRLSGTLMAGGDGKDVEVDPGRPAEADLQLEPARYAAGIVVDEQGRPIPGAAVEAGFRFGRGIGGVERTASRADGTFELFNFPVEPRAFRGQKGDLTIGVSHPDHVGFEVPDIDALGPGQLSGFRIVLPTGRQVAGRVVNADGVPLSGAMVEVVEANDRRGGLTDARGQFAIRGLGTGPATLGAFALPIRQKARLPLDLDADKVDLEIRLEPIVLPAGLKTHAVLGMTLADLTPELKSAYDLQQSRGALILDPGPDPDRLKVGQLLEGDSFWIVGHVEVGTVREFVAQLLREVGDGPAAEHSIRVVYGFRRDDMAGNNTQFIRLTKADVDGLRALADRLKAEPR